MATFDTHGNRIDPAPTPYKLETKPPEADIPAILAASKESPSAKSPGISIGDHYFALAATAAVAFMLGLYTGFKANGPQPPQELTQVETAVSGKPESELLAATPSAQESVRVRPLYKSELSASR